MEQFLKPDKLALDPQEVGASDKFDHWLDCFEAFIDTTTAIDTDAAKLHVLRARVSETVYGIFRDAATYADAIELLKGQFRKSPNVVYARHLLTTRKQQPGESCAQFLRALRVLARACDCKAVSAAQNTEDLIRDAYVAGIESTYIQQRLLEQDDLDLRKTATMAETLEAASHNLGSYLGSRSTDGSTATAAPAGPKCYFCGLPKHPRRHCPAKDAICSGCGKLGHFVKVCRAKPLLKTCGAMCAPRARPSLMQAAAARESPSLMRSPEVRESPSLMRSPEVRESPSLRLASRQAEQEASSVTSSDGDEDGFFFNSTVASICLDQSQPHQLSKSIMEIKLA
ncbi:uncharacterized protein LOC144492397 isoform X2 [Mustelus asterias]